MVERTLDRMKGISSRTVKTVLVLFDYLAVVASYILALWIRFDFKFDHIESQYVGGYKKFIFIYAAVCVIIFALFKLYNRVWRYVGLDVVNAAVEANFTAVVFNILFMSAFVVRMPISYYLIGGFLQLTFSITVRVIYRILRDISDSRSSKNGERIMIIGAGSAGQIISREIKRSRVDRVMCYIDDDPNKQGCYLDGIIVEGNRNCILSAAEKYKIDTIILAVPSASASVRRDFLNICSEIGCELKQIAPVYVNQRLTLSSVSNVKVEDLLGREAIEINSDSVCDFLEDKTVLVTGGGGSIGSELCRQIASHNPKQLIIFDIYENNAYSIQLELRKKYPYADIVTLIGSVRDSGRLNDVFSRYRPDIVFHAAAHKHVPLMEDSPCESIKNNVLGTYKTACAAMKYGCRRFVLISTDKAVNPANVMGASKRLCEMIVQTFDKKIKNGTAGEIKADFLHDVDLTPDGERLQTEFVAVRFGNVLGSNGSVVPVFKRQIENGGPVTVTHPDIIRYFMTVSEAVSLVLQAGAYAHGGEIFVLDMGAPVKIDTLARNLIRLSGLRPDVDIKIEYTGLRPGEKLYEEKLMADEGLEKTDNNLIFVGHPVDFDEDVFLGKIPELYETAYKNDDNIRELVMSAVPTYHPANATCAALKQ